MRRIQFNGRDWQVGYMCYFNYLAAQHAAFRFPSYLYNNPLVDKQFDYIDSMTPSGV